MSFSSLLLTLFGPLVSYKENFNPLVSYKENFSSKMNVKTIEGLKFWLY
jgi:hypothetical protein